MDEAASRLALLAGAGWDGAAELPLAGDASTRRYTRLKRGRDSAVLMQAGAGAGDDTRRFLRIAGWLGLMGFSAPEVIAEDAGAGLVLMEDLGDGSFSARIAEDPEAGAELTEAAGACLTALHRQAVPDWLAPYTPETLAGIAALAGAFFLPAFGREPTEADTLPGLIAEAATRLLTGPVVFCHRDYHAGNLIWLPFRKAHARTGMLDFQDAFAGHPAYDLVSFLQDARREVPEPVETMALSRFIAAGGHDPDLFGAAYAMLGAQRALRILGVFTRLALSQGRTQYLPMIPRVRAQLTRNLRHPALADLAEAIRRAVPEPGPTELAALADRCRTVSR